MRFRKIEFQKFTIESRAEGPAKEKKMATSEAQKRAVNNYRKKNTRQIILRFFPGEDGLYQKAKGLGSPGIKRLIAEHKEATEK